MRCAIILSTLAAAATASAAQTTVLIDDFSDGEQVLDRSSVGSLIETAAASSAVGGSRVAGLDVLETPFGITSTVEIDRNNTDVYAFSSGAANTAASSLLYDAGDTGLGLELRSDSVFDVKFLFADMDFDMSVTLEDASGNLATAGVTVPETGNANTAQILVSELETDGVFDLGNVHSVRFDFNAPFNLFPPGEQVPPEAFLTETPVAALDFIIDEISVTTPPIPAPGSAVLAGAGLLLMGTRRRRG